MSFHRDSLTQIFDRYDTDKNSRFHNYSRQYDSLVAGYRDKEIRFLELGVFHGESLKAWRDAFPRAVSIVGIDVNAGCTQYEDAERSIWVAIGDASDTAFVQQVHTRFGPFDVIVDDASHTNKDVITSFEALFPLLNDGGLYIVEDTICFKSPTHIVPGFPDHLTYFTRYFPFLNQWRYDSTEGDKDQCVDPFKIQKKTTDVFERSVDMITYGVSFIAITKHIRHHWRP